MEYEIEFSDWINDDVKEISDYIERISFSIDTADKTIAKIMTTAYMLRLFPYMYPKFHKHYHSFTVRNRRVFYYVDESRKVVIIYRILWGFQSYEKLL